MQKFLGYCTSGRESNRRRTKICARCYANQKISPTKTTIFNSYMLITPHLAYTEKFEGGQKPKGEQ